MHSDDGGQDSPGDSPCSPQHSSSHASSSASSRTFKPFGYGQVFPSFSPRSSGAGDTEFDWTMAEEKILRDVAQWLSPADLRRARLVCKTWYGALATLTTRAFTPAETLVPQWKVQLEAMLQAFPCMQELTISSRLSSVAAQQLGVLATAKQLQVLNIPQAQALQDRSLLPFLQPLASHLRELRINGASSLSRRSLLLLSVLANLQVLELRNCGKISWLELQQAWRAACMAHEVQAAAEANTSSGAGATTHSSSSGGGSSGTRFSSSGGGFGSKLGAWLPTGRLFRTSSPSSNSIQSAVAWQRTTGTTNSLLAKVHDIARGTSSAAAVAVAQLGIGAVGNGRSSCGGSMAETPARSLLYRKQKEGAAAAASSLNSFLLPHEEVFETDGALEFGGVTGCFPVRSGLLRLRSRSAITASSGAAAPDVDSPKPVASMLSRVGSLMWHSSSAASAGTGGGSSSDSFTAASGSSLAAQASCVQAALQAYIAQEERAAAAGDSGTELLPVAPCASSVSSGVDAAARVRREAVMRLEGANISGSSSGPNKLVAAAAAGGGQPSAASSSQQPTQAAATQQQQQGSSSSNASSSAGPPASSASQQQAPGGPDTDRYKPRRRTTGDRALPAMPFTKLSSLSFSCTEATLKSPGPELAAVAALSTLTALDISKCKLPDAVFVHLQALGKLQKLKLSGLWSMGDAGLQHVAQLTTLKSLTLSEAMHVTAQGLLSLRGLTGLNSLALGFTQDLGGHGTLAHVVNALPLLQCLEVAAPSWGDLDCEMLSSAAGAASAGAGAAQAPGMSAASSSTQLAASAGGSDGGGGGVGSGGSAGAAGADAPQMLWDLAAGLSSRSFSSIRPSSSRSASSSRLLLPQAGRANSSSMRAASFNRIPSRSFGSFSSMTAGGAAGLGGVSGSQSSSTPAPVQALLVLRLHGCRALTKKGMAALRQLPALHTLVLEDCKEVRAAEVISQGLLPPNLTSLTLRAMPFGNLFSSCVSVPCCGPRLRKLELVSLEGAHEGQLRRLLSFFPNTTELSLAGCAELRDAALQHMLLMPKLQQLSLSACSIVGAPGGLEHLQALQQLRVLSLKSCSQLDDTGVSCLAGLPALEELDVSDCGGLSEQALLGVAQAAPRLVRLDVSGCRAVGRSLLTACPHYLHVKHSL